MINIERKPKNIYVKMVTGNNGKQQQLCAADESEDPNFIDLYLLFPLQLNAEVYNENGFNLLEKVTRINQLTDGLHYVISWIYNDGDYLHHQEVYLRFLKSRGLQKSNDAILEYVVERFSTKALKGFQSEDISLSLRKRVAGLIKKIITEGRFYKKPSYSFAFIRQVIGLKNLQEVDLNSFEEEMRHNRFLDLTENEKLNRYLEYQAGLKTEYDCYIEEWWQEINRDTN